MLIGQNYLGWTLQQNWNHAVSSEMKMAKVRENIEKAKNTGKLKGKFRFNSKKQHDFISQKIQISLKISRDKKGIYWYH